MTKWTEEQMLAIVKGNTNIIVSAGAGSGKTAVLTQRVITNLKKGMHINELLILTFTNNAAMEMKTRIKKAILEDDEIKNEAKLTDSADITTFDAYVLSLVKKYHYLLNLDSDITLIDSSIIKKKKKDFIEEIFDELFTQKNEKFIKFVTDFGTKNARQTKKTILNLDYSFDLITKKEDYLNNYIESYYNKNNLDNLFHQFENTLLKRVESIKNLLLNLSFEVDSDYYDKIYKTLEPLLKSSNYQEIRSNLDFKLSPLRNASDKAKYYKEQISKIIKDLKSLTEFHEQVLKDDLLKTKEYAEVIIEILLKLTQKVNAYKFEYQVFEFNDISKFALEILDKNEDIRNELKNYYKEIMIDEYQDTSDVQEQFIKYIENNNVYMVGDIKQSIYRFRNANPDIFKIKYDAYKEGNNGFKIDLNKNFRSRGEVLDSINQIFNHIMDDNIGNANYIKEHQLIFGNNTFIEEGNNNYNNNLEIYNYLPDPNFTKEEMEAFIIANDIKKKVTSNYEVFDKTLRPCKYSDFCILIDRTTAFDTYKKIFDFLNVPINIYKDDNIMISDETSLINNIIKFIINIKNNKINETSRFCFASIARSYLYQLDDQTIYDTISQNKINESEIYEIAYNISKNLDSLSNEEIIKKIIYDYKFYDKMIIAGNLNYRSIILDNLINKFKELNKVNMTIYEVNDYLDSLINDEESIKIPALLNKNDSVTITNIHKSKGLEYKICYFPSLHKEFNLMDLNNRIIFNTKFGLILPNYDNGFKSTFVNFLNKETYIKDEISERIRLFYVALTRAKEKMIMVTNLIQNDNCTTDENGIIDYLTRINYRSYKDILESVYPYIHKYIENIDLPEINIGYKYSQKNNINIDTEDNHKIIVNEKEYISELINEEHYSKSENKLITPTEVSNMEYGTHMHYILENTDFKNPDYSLLTNEEQEIIQGLLNNQIMSNIKDANIYHEYEFIYENNKQIKTGIIDLMLEYPDHIDIIDYKLKNTNDPAYLKQLNGYKEYIENKNNKPTYIYLYSLLNKELIDLNKN
ncbi:MAG: UvrD-helicase domain-containing protein [Bacilli bacterium]|nr:UvrD-helicase domain-containing protein [Bacilli bacterium]